MAFGSPVGFGMWVNLGRGSQTVMVKLIIKVDNFAIRGSLSRWNTLGRGPNIMRMARSASKAASVKRHISFMGQDVTGRGGFIMRTGHFGMREASQVRKIIILRMGLSI